MTYSCFCPVRKIWVRALPEEKIRQALIQQMVQVLDYPLGSLALEKSLSQLPHLSQHPHLPSRRADLIVYGKHLHPHHSIYPLLLIEFKAVPLTNKDIRQVIGYNEFVGAYFIAIVNQTTIDLGWYNASQQNYHFQKGLLPYPILLQHAQSFIQC